MQESTSIDRSLRRQILDFCRHIAGSCKITAICQTDDYTIEVPSAKSTIEVLVILLDFQPRLMSFVRSIGQRNVVFFTVDQWIFERDVERGFLGEALARLLIFPYTSVANASYLRRQELVLKKRLITELLENLAHSYPELSYSLRIMPEYFMYEAMLNRVRVFPPMAYGTSHLLSGEANHEKVKIVLEGYKEALKQLEKEKIVTLSGHYVFISEGFIEKRKNQIVRFTNIIKNAPRALFASLFGVFPQLLNFLSQNAEAFFRFQTPPWKMDFDFSRKLVDPLEFVFVPTAKGFVSLSDQLDIRGYAEHVLKNGVKNKIKVEEFGGVLNDVYLLTAGDGSSEQRVLVKRFRDLTSFKWFPLSMWSIGARSFALLGRSRLEKETAINEFLNKGGFRVPKILHVSANERLVFMEYLEGENLGSVVKRIALEKNGEKLDQELSLVSEVGQIYAKVHALNVVLGDTKPENIMISPQREIFLLDFEQASRNGDKSWDVACFLYYSGHYLPLHSEGKAKILARAFVDGYLGGGGSAEVIKCAALARYTRVFSIFTLPGILRVMSNVCKDVKGPKCKKL